MKNILYICELPAYHIANEITVLKEHGFNIIVLNVFKTKFQSIENYDENIILYNMHDNLNNYPSIKIIEIIYKFHINFKLIDEIIFKHKIDILYSSWSSMVILDTYFIKKRFPKLIWIHRYLIYPASLSSLKINIENFIIKKYTKYINHIIFHTEEMENYFIKYVNNKFNDSSLLFEKFNSSYFLENERYFNPNSKKFKLIFLGTVIPNTANDVLKEIEYLAKDIEIYINIKNEFKYLISEKNIKFFDRKEIGKELNQYIQKFDGILALYNSNTVNKERINLVIPNRITLGIPAIKRFFIPENQLNASKKLLKSYDMVYEYRDCNDLVHSLEHNKKYPIKNKKILKNKLMLQKEFIDIFNKKGNKNMKIAYIVSIGKGLESFIYREIEEMTKRGMEIILFATKYSANDIFSPKKEWKVNKLNMLSIGVSFLTGLISKPITTLKLLKSALASNTVVELLIALDYIKQMKKDKIEHIHCHFGDRKYFIGYYCKKLLNIPLSLTVHAHELYANPNEEFFKFAVHEADKIIAISQKNKDILINEFKVDANKIEMIRLSIDLTNFKKEKKIKVLTVARYTERKGFKELFEAIKIIDRDNIEFITVGFGDLDLDAMVKELRIEDKVTIFGKMGAKQLRYFYNSCDVFCLPSKTTKDEGAEGIPVVLMEAMASEMIIVTTPNGSISELVSEVLVEEANSQSLANGLIKSIEMLKDKSIGRKNREKVLLEYNEKNIDILKEYLYD